jgi:hypothetical protein
VCEHGSGAADQTSRHTRTIDCRDIGTVAVFEPVVKGLRLHFVAAGNGFRDRETGSHWTLLGQATAGSLKGKQLPAHQLLDTFWFAWVAFHPDTRVIQCAR